MNKILLNILGVVSMLALFGLVIGGSMILEMENKRVENEARYQCAVSSKYEVLDGEAAVSYPVKDLYSACLKEKGIN